MGPQRIICLTEEPTEVLYLLGAQDRIVGISGFTVRPPEARIEKPKVSAFLSAKIDKIMALRPDLAIGFSDIQADIAQQLIRAGVEVWIANHRGIDGIIDYVRRLGSMVGMPTEAKALADQLALRVEESRAAHVRSRKPVVYFEEWDEPQITGIQWVSELIEAAGGVDAFPEHSTQPLAKNRIIADPSEVVRRAPDIVIGSWCGKRFQPKTVASRPGWGSIPAVANGHVYEIKSPIILQPGPAALTAGLDALRDIIDRWHAAQGQ